MGSGILMRSRHAALTAIFLFLSAFWAGVLGFFLAFGARIVLLTSPSRHAGGLVNRSLLDALDGFSVGAGAVLVAVFLAIREDPGWTAFRKALALRLLALSLVAALASGVLITPAMSKIRERRGPDLFLASREDPDLRDWGRLHGLSFVALLTRVLSVVGVFALAYPRGPSQSRADDPRAKWRESLNKGPYPEETPEGTRAQS